MQKQTKETEGSVTRHLDPSWIFFFVFFFSTKQVPKPTDWSDEDPMDNLAE